MSEITLQQSTTSALADRTLQEMITQFETVFPQRILSYYVEGSYADQSAVITSDLDLTIVFRQRLIDVEEEKHARQLVAACQEMSALELDVTLAEETRLHQHADPMFKLGARLVYGEEIRTAIPLIPITTWARQRLHAAYWLMINVFQRAKPVSAPLPFPDECAPFYGYTTRMLRLADGSEVPTTRNLIRVVGWIATACIAYQAQHYVVRKRDCVASYRQTIDDEWTPLLEQIDQRCRSTWQYRIPTTTGEQAELLAILQNTLAFENHFLQLYRHFLLAELTSRDQTAQQEALRILHNTALSDPEIQQAFAHLQIIDERKLE